MKKRITVISFFVFVLVVMLLIGLFTRKTDEKRIPLDSGSGEADVVEIDLLPDSLVF